MLLILTAWLVGVSSVKRGRSSRVRPVSWASSVSRLEITIRQSLMPRAVDSVRGLGLPSRGAVSRTMEVRVLRIMRMRRCTSCRAFSYMRVLRKPAKIPHCRRRSVLRLRKSLAHEVIKSVTGGIRIMNRQSLPAVLCLPAEETSHARPEYPRIQRSSRNPHQSHRAERIGTGRHRTQHAPEKGRRTGAARHPQARRNLPVLPWQRAQDAAGDPALDAGG